MAVVKSAREERRELSSIISISLIAERGTQEKMNLAAALKEFII